MRLKFQDGKENQPIIELENMENSVFSNQYILAEKIFNALLTDDEARKHNNIISFCGDRGTGKTSCMMSFKSKCERDFNDCFFLKEIGNTALALSCRHTGYRLGKTAFGWLLKGKADPNTANLSGQTPMMILFGGHKANEKYVPYGWSAGSDDPTEILEKLLEAGADVDKTDNRGNTLLHYVAACCRDSMAQKTIELLLDFKLPDVNAVNNEGKTAMDVAADYNNDNLVRLLLKYS